MKHARNIEISSLIICRDPPVPSGIRDPWHRYRIITLGSIINGICIINVREIRYITHLYSIVRKILLHNSSPIKPRCKIIRDGSIGRLQKNGIRRGCSIRDINENSGSVEISSLIICRDPPVPSGIRDPWHRYRIITLGSIINGICIINVREIRYITHLYSIVRKIYLRYGGPVQFRGQVC